MEYLSDPNRMAELVDFFQLHSRRVLFGDGALAELGEECAHLKAKKIVLIRDADIETLEERVRGVLDDAGIELLDVYTDVVPNPTS